MQIECQRYMRLAKATRVPERESTSVVPKTQADFPKKVRSPKKNRSIGDNSIATMMPNTPQINANIFSVIKSLPINIFRFVQDSHRNRQYSKIHIGLIALSVSG